MVGHSDEGLEWQSPVETGYRHDNRLGRIPQGLGSNPSNAADRRPVVCAGKENAHKLPRTTGSHLGGPDFYKGLWVLLRIDNTTAVAYINHLGGWLPRNWSL